MKKTLLGLVLLSATVLVGSATVDAAQQNDTEVGIGFTGSTTEGTGPFVKNLNIVQYPTAFNFGTKNTALTASNQTFAQDTDASKQWLAVLDDRRADEAKGYTLSAKLSKLTNGATEADKVKDLSGNLTMNVSELKDYVGWKFNPAKTDYVVPNPDEATNIGASLTGTYNSTVLGKSLALPIGGEAVELWSTNEKSKVEGDTDVNVKGVITDVSAVKLNITKAPEKSTQYKGNVTWSLSNAYAGK